jgi:hypothetical protein
MDAVRSFEASVNFYQTTRDYIPEDNTVEFCICLFFINGKKKILHQMKIMLPKYASYKHVNQNKTRLERVDLHKMPP